MPAAMVVTIRHHVRHIVIIVASLRAAGESELESTFKQLEVRFVSRDQGDSSIVTIDLADFLARSSAAARDVE